MLWVAPEAPVIGFPSRSVIVAFILNVSPWLGIMGTPLVLVLYSIPRYLM